MRASLLLAVAGVVAIAMAEGCGGAGSPTATGSGGAGASGSPGSGKSSSEATTGTGGSGTGGSGTTTSASTSSTGAGGSGTGGSGTGGSGTTTSVSSSGGAACPDESGKYAVEVDGLGCGDLLAGAPQCIEAGTVPCQIQLVSKGSGGSALNGTVAIDMSGDFTGGVVVKEGTVNRSGCTGTWNAATSQLTVDCGGMGTSQSCTATLTRTGSTCP